MEVQQRYNICSAACNELMDYAANVNPWVKFPPAVENTRAVQLLFKVAPSPGRKIEYSVASGVVPIPVAGFISIMTNVKEWAEVFCNIVHCENCEVAAGVMSAFVPTGLQQSRYTTITSLIAINAELLYPMPYKLPRRFRFIRSVKELAPDVVAVVDVSTEYFMCCDSSWHTNCKRRPSGVIVRKIDEQNSVVIWIENMEVPEFNAGESMYSGIEINLAFDAKRWMSMVSNHEKRIRSKFVTRRLPTTGNVNQVRKAMLKLGKTLKAAYLSYITESPNEGHNPGWNIPEDGIWKLWDDTGAKGNEIFMAVTTIRVKATPRSVFTFLVQRTPQVQWPSLVNMVEPTEEVIKLLSDDNSTCIVRAKSMKKIVSRQQTPQNFPQDYQYVLHEASSNDYCSLVLSSSAINMHHFNSALQFGEKSYPLRPSGFSIIPVGSGGLLSDDSIITMGLQHEFSANVETEVVLERMRQFGTGVIHVIREAFTAADNVNVP